ncbi:uncharacterized protein PS065_021029 [Dugong dugon]
MADGSRRYRDSLHINIIPDRRISQPGPDGSVPPAAGAGREEEAPTQTLLSIGRVGVGEPQCGRRLALPCRPKQRGGPATAPSPPRCHLRRPRGAASSEAACPDTGSREAGREGGRLGAGIPRSCFPAPQTAPWPPRPVALLAAAALGDCWELASDASRLPRSLFRPLQHTRACRRRRSCSSRNPRFWWDGTDLHALLAGQRAGTGPTALGAQVLSRAHPPFSLRSAVAHCTAVLRTQWTSKVTRTPGMLTSVQLL